MIERIFHLKENKTNIKTELIAGLTTFMAMSYAIFVIPSILVNTGMDYNAVYGATIITSVIGTLIVGLVANVPYAQCAGIGLASLFTYYICGTLGYDYHEALAMVFICGVINILVTLTSLRKRIIRAIPLFFQEAITVGIGLFISYIGLMNAGLLSFSASGVAGGIAFDVVPSLTSFNSASILLACIGLIITIILLVRKVKGAYLIGIVLTTIIGLPLGVTNLPDFSNYTIIPNISSTFLSLDFKGLFTINSGLLIVLMTIFTLCISDLFDTIGVFIGTGKKAGIFKVDKNGNMPEKLEKALFADSIGTMVGSLLGTSNVSTYVESSAGIEAGGRTGLTSVFVAMCLLLSLLLAPIVKIVPMAALAPTLILIGVSMMENIGNINFKDIKVAIPAFFVILMMPLSYSITTGIEFGFITYAITNLASDEEDRDKISIMIYIFAVIFVIKYIYGAIG